MADEIEGLAPSASKFAQRKWMLHYAAGGGLGILLALFTWFSNASEQKETRAFMRSQVTSSQDEAKKAREQLGTLVERMVDASDRSTAAQTAAAAAMQSLTQQQKEMCLRLELAQRAAGAPQ